MASAFSRKVRAPVAEVGAVGRFRLRCQFCPSLLSTPLEMVRHLSDHFRKPGTPVFPCPLSSCRKSFFVYTNLETHLVDDHGIKPAQNQPHFERFLCSLCGHLYPSLQSLQTHRWNKHSRPVVEHSKVPKQVPKKRSIDLSSSDVDSEAETETESVKDYTQRGKQLEEQLNLGWEAQQQNHHPPPTPSNPPLDKELSTQCAHCDVKCPTVMDLAHHVDQVHLTSGNSIITSPAQTLVRPSLLTDDSSAPKASSQLSVGDWPSIGNREAGPGEPLDLAHPRGINFLTIKTLNVTAVALPSVSLLKKPRPESDRKLSLKNIPAAGTNQAISNFVVPGKEPALPTPASTPQESSPPSQNSTALVKAPTTPGVPERVSGPATIQTAARPCQEMLEDVTKISVQKENPGNTDKRTQEILGGDIIASTNPPEIKEERPNLAEIVPQKDIHDTYQKSGSSTSCGGTSSKDVATANIGSLSISISPKIGSSFETSACPHETGPLCSKFSAVMEPKSNPKVEECSSQEVFHGFQEIPDTMTQPLAGKEGLGLTNSSLLSDGDVASSITSIGPLNKHVNCEQGQLTEAALERISPAPKRAKVVVKTNENEEPNCFSGENMNSSVSKGIRQNIIAGVTEGPTQQALDGIQEILEQLTKDLEKEKSREYSSEMFERKAAPDNDEQAKQLSDTSENRTIDLAICPDLERFNEIGVGQYVIVKDELLNNEDADRSEVQGDIRQKLLEATRQSKELAHHIDNKDEVLGNANGDEHESIADSGHKPLDKTRQSKEVSHHMDEEEEHWGEKKTQEANKPEKNFACQECTKAFTTKRGLTIHLRSHKKTRAESTTPQAAEKPLDANFSCQDCCITFTSTKCLIKHVRFKHEKRSNHKCARCGENFVSLRGLTAHFNKEHYNEGEMHEKDDSNINNNNSEIALDKAKQSDTATSLIQERKSPRARLVPEKY